MKTVRSNWSNTLLICRKCSQKLGGGFGPKGRTPLAKALRKELALKKGRKATLGIIEVKCLGVCPHGSVTVVSGAHPREWALVRAGADTTEVAKALALIPQPD